MELVSGEIESMKHYGMQLMDVRQLCGVRRKPIPATSFEKQSAIKALRSACVESDKRSCSASELSLRLFESARSIASSVILLFTPVKNKHSMCLYYGHVIEPNWKGRFPCCAECGSAVKDPSMLRRADLYKAELWA